MSECPECGQPGRKVKPITLDSLVVEWIELPDAVYRFCATVGCDVAWFGSEGHRIPVGASRVAIGQKSTEPGRTVCYCFGHAARDLTAEVTRSIAEACKRGEDRCPETNPQGSCCLGNVHSVLKDALTSCDCSQRPGSAAP